ncbi:hypothetical protein DFJ74DRAFT_767261 [Hyaloraphidium curvatum]|nr:hypothetical protein DFJ74DRAFT_767261 [Hyaloraphidium curvatum]
MASTRPGTSADSTARNRRLLLDALERTGLIHKLRAQIRAGVAQEVLARSPPVVQAPDDYTRALNSVVFGYLLRRGLDLTVSVLLAESGMGTEAAVLGEHGILAVLGLPEVQGEGPLLERFLRALASEAPRAGDENAPSRSFAGNRIRGDEGRGAGSESKGSKPPLSFSRPMNIAVQLLESAGLGTADIPAGLPSKPGGSVATQVRPTVADAGHSTGAAVKSDREAQTVESLPKLKANRSTGTNALFTAPRDHITSSRGTQSSSSRRHPVADDGFMAQQCKDLTESLAKEAQRSRKLEERLDRVEQEKEGWRNEVRRLRREVDGLRRAVLDDAELRVSTARRDYRLDSVDGSVKGIDVTGLFDNIPEESLFGDREFRHSQRDSKPGRSRDPEDYELDRRGRYSALRERERDIRTRSQEDMRRGRSDTGSLVSNASLDLDPEIQKLVEDIKRRDLDGSFGFSDM